MSHITEEIRNITGSLPQGVRLVAVSKFHPESSIEEAYAAGQRVFGESHAQELSRKYGNLPKDIEWHFIGHLQTNKVKQIAPYVAMIHAVDSMKLLREIDKQAAKAGRVIPCLLQIHVAHGQDSEPGLLACVSSHSGIYFYKRRRNDRGASGNRRAGNDDVKTED